MCLPILVLKILKRVIILLVLAVILFLGWTFVQVYKEAITARPVKSQAIVVMGSAEYNGIPSRDLASRLDEAQVLFGKKYAPKIFLTGGSVPGDHFSEAGAGKTYLEKRGVPSSAIVANPVGRDTWESVVSVSKLLSADKIHSVIVVSDGFHLLRSTQMLNSLGYSTSAAPALNSPVHGLQLGIDFARETVAVAASKIVGYKFLSVLRHGN